MPQIKVNAILFPVKQKKTKKRRLISVVLPCLNESGNLPLIIPEIIAFIPKKYDYEIICIDDGSSDDSFDVIKKMAFKNKKIRGESFYKRFGHQAALIAGIKAARGEAIVTMDSDFQHPPKLLPEIIKLWEKGHDLVKMRKNEDKNVGMTHKITRTICYQIWSFFSDGVLTYGVSDFRLMDRKVAKYILKSGEREMFLRGVASLGARNPVTLPYKVEKRRHGKSSYNLGAFINMFFTGLVSFSTKPVRMAAFVGIFISFFGSVMLVYDLIRALVSGRRIIEGWISLMFVVMILNGFIIFYLGILGEYLSIVFKEVKKRPKYLIAERVNL